MISFAKIYYSLQKDNVQIILKCLFVFILYSFPFLPILFEGKPIHNVIADMLFLLSIRETLFTDSFVDFAPKTTCSLSASKETLASQDRKWVYFVLYRIFSAVLIKKENWQRANWNDLYWLVSALTLLSFVTATKHYAPKPFLFW